MDMVNHMQYVYSMMKRNKDKSVDLNDSSSVTAFEFLKQHKTVVDPTIGVYEMVFRNTSENIHEMEPNFDNLPLPLQILFGSTGMPDAQAKANALRYKSMFALVKALHDKGIPIVAGTDMGFPGYSVARELELYVQAGLTPMEALQSATITSATVMGMQKTAGSIRAGKAADLVILDADPVSNIRNVRKVWKVFKDGEEYDPHVLHRMVGFRN
jgi:imidazolonepropionase-like amidohydrolase